MMVVPLILSACAQSQPTSAAFFENILALCGETFSGEVVSTQAIDEEWRESELIVGPVSCETDVIRMPLAVGDDRSRTWVLSRTDGELVFRHEHFEPDGSPSAVTQYGGPAAPGGTATSQSFPADETTKANFTENGIARSNTNVWTLTVTDDALTYALARPATEAEDARDFRAVFELPE